MCGITGYVSFSGRKIGTEEYYRAHRKIAHRGPDDEGFLYRDETGKLELLRGDDTVAELSRMPHLRSRPPSSLILGHRRLSIIDLSPAGHQPFRFEQFSLVYNGEIYNYIELREELEKVGYRFETHTDTEVFLKAFHHWGEEAFGRFNGMWAAAIHDEEKDTLLLTRDRFGIKPLYYAQRGDTLIFGSEIRFVASFFDRLEIDEQSLFDYLRYTWLEHSERTFFRGIRMLEPWRLLRFSAEGGRVERFYDLHPKKASVEACLDRALRLRMRADVPVGALLSGGIDSTLLVCKIRDDLGVKAFDTFTADFREKRFSERDYVEATLKKTGYRGHFIRVDAEEIRGMMEEMMRVHETPVRSMSVFLQYQIYRYIREHTDVRVVLSGQGADELFTGYTGDYYVFLLSLLLRGRWRRFYREQRAIRRRQGLSVPGMVRRLAVTLAGEYFSPPDRYGLFRHPYTPAKRKRRYNSLLKNRLYNEVTFSALREYLRDEDKNSMHFSIESRLPYLDVHLAEAAFALKEEEYIVDGVSKSPLRRIAAGYIPESILKRRDKMGFVSPQELWQRDTLKEDFDRVFEAIGREGLFQALDTERILELYRRYSEGSLKDWTVIWRLYALYYFKKSWEVEG